MDGVQDDHSSDADTASNDGGADTGHGTADRTMKHSEASEAVEASAAVDGSVDVGLDGDGLPAGAAADVSPPLVPASSPPLVDSVPHLLARLSELAARLAPGTSDADALGIASDAQGVLMVLLRRGTGDAAVQDAVRVAGGLVCVTRFALERCGSYGIGAAVAVLRALLDGNVASQRYAIVRLLPTHMHALCSFPASSALLQSLFPELVTRLVHHGGMSGDGAPALTALIHVAFCGRAPGAEAGVVDPDSEQWMRDNGCECVALLFLRDLVCLDRENMRALLTAGAQIMQPLISRVCDPPARSADVEALDLFLVLAAGGCAFSVPDGGLCVASRLASVLVADFTAGFMCKIVASKMLACVALLASRGLPYASVDNLRAVAGFRHVLHCMCQREFPMKRGRLAAVSLHGFLGYSLDLGGGAAAAVLAALPSKSAAGTCGVCTEDADAGLVVTPCGHDFHADCLATWVLLPSRFQDEDGDEEDDDDEDYARLVQVVQAVRANGCPTCRDNFVPTTPGCVATWS